MTDTAREAVARATYAEDHDPYADPWEIAVRKAPDVIAAYYRSADSAISAFTAWLQENGWQIVPKEPTSDMIAAWREVFSPWPYENNAYHAMLAAAPKMESDRRDG